MLIPHWLPKHKPDSALKEWTQASVVKWLFSLVKWAPHKWLIFLSIFLYLKQGDHPLPLGLHCIIISAYVNLHKSFGLTQLIAKPACVCDKILLWMTTICQEVPSGLRPVGFCQRICLSVVAFPRVVCRVPCCFCFVQMKLNLLALIICVCLIVFTWYDTGSTSWWVRYSKDLNIRQWSFAWLVQDLIITASISYLNPKVSSCFHKWLFPWFWNIGHSTKLLNQGCYKLTDWNNSS